MKLFFVFVELWSFDKFLCIGCFWDVADFSFFSFGRVSTTLLNVHPFEPHFNVLNILNTSGASDFHWVLMNNDIAWF